LIRKDVVGTRTVFWKIKVLTLESIVPLPSASMEHGCVPSVLMAVLTIFTRARAPGRRSGSGPANVAMKLSDVVPSGIASSGRSSSRDTRRKRHHPPCYLVEVQVLSSA